MKRNRKRNKVMAEINITPFTDVILVLLIIFMITTPMLMQPGIKINLPKTQTTDNEDTSNIEVLISKEGFVHMNGKQIHESNVEATVKNLLAVSPNKPIVIKADKDVKYDYVIKFMDTAKKAGAAKFALAVDNSSR
jgi:biopolymer transport protein ExbD